jgi:hypothetical protein
MTNSINNNIPAGGVPTTPSTTTTNKVGTPDADTVNSLQNQLNAGGPSATTTSNNAATRGSGITSEDMKNFVAEMNKFCVNQGILTTPKATRD